MPLKIYFMSLSINTCFIKECFCSLLCVIHSWNESMCIMSMREGIDVCERSVFIVCECNVNDFSASH